jgi:hypothetical protein
VDDQTKERSTVGAITDWLVGQWTGRYIDRREQALWESAASLSDVGEYTAQWLEGRIEHQPGYCASVDVDEDEVPGLAALLAACCRSGYVTTNSQAAANCRGFDGAWWEQRAAVEGFAGDATLDRLTAMANAARLAIQAGRVVQRTSHRHAVTVTKREGRPVTGFGVLVSRSDLADDHVGYGICSPSAIDDLINAWQVLVYDPEWGRNDRLWPALARFVHEGGR